MIRGPQLPPWARASVLAIFLAVAPIVGDAQALKLDIPDVTVKDQDGNSVRFYRNLVKGKVVAMNFIFTTCPTVCPPMAASFSGLQTSLGEAAGRDVHLLSVSVDPVTDTPERLKAWGERFGAGPGWTFVTGNPSEIDKLLESLGVFPPDLEDHSPTFLIGNDATKVWIRRDRLVPAAELLEMVNRVRTTSTEPPR